MRFSTLLVAASAPVGLLARESVDQLSPGELVAFLEKHNLAVVPKSELTDALTELTALLRSQQQQQQQQQRRRLLHVFRRDNGTANTSGQGAGGGGGGGGGDDDGGGGDGGAVTYVADLGDDEDGTMTAQLLGLGDLADLIRGLIRAIGDLPEILKAVQGLLTSEFLNGFRDAMVYLAQTLHPPAPELVQKLIGKAGPLIDVLDGLDLEGLVDQLKGADLAGLVGGALKLLSDRNLENIESLVSNGAALLTPSFVNQTATLIGGAAPLLGELGPLLDKVVPLLDRLGDVDLEGILDALAPLLEKESIRGLVGLLNNAGQLLDKETVASLKSLLRTAGPLLDKLGDVDLDGLLDAVGPLLTKDC
ncbi:hypothetical protein VTH06DRAFT_7548 [Thermothelomyces fergusii]